MYGRFSKGKFFTYKAIGPMHSDLKFKFIEAPE
jgi:hypothetical protein